MKKQALVMLAGLTALSLTLETRAQHLVIERLDAALLDVAAPDERVTGGPGHLALQSVACRTDVLGPEIRRRIVDIAVQEWAYFGLSVDDQTVRDDPSVLDDTRFAAPPDRRRLPRPELEEVLRTATSVAGYWAVTSDGGWIVAGQNAAWREPQPAGRWLNPWSAAFVSWVMCEAGLGTADQFRRAIAHHVYIDQAISARDGRAPAAAFQAYDIGEHAVSPGDLLCASRAPAYQTIAERRRQMGVGARSHCDIVVGLDEERKVILAIGGNVRGTVALKLLPATDSPSGGLQPLRDHEDPDARIMFAHLLLRADAIEAEAIKTSPTVLAWSNRPDIGMLSQFQSGRVDFLK